MQPHRMSGHAAHSESSMAYQLKRVVTVSTFLGKDSLRTASDPGFVLMLMGPVDWKLLRHARRLSEAGFVVPLLSLPWGSW